MRERAVEVLAVSALATVMTMAIAMPVLRAPSARLFGMDIVGRHHDPFTVMEQFGQPVALSLSTQPVTDFTGAALASVAGPVAAYNWLVLITFPLSVAAAYLLARYLTLSPAAAAVAAIAYGFAPFHLAQAAYHPHIAQTQWMPLYLLALWRCLDAATPGRVCLLAVAAIGVTLSNFYGGLIAATLTPVAVVAHWLVIHRTQSRSLRPLGMTAGTLGLLAAAGLAYAWSAAHATGVPLAGFAFPRADLFRYSAKWWGYLVPPVAHPLLGTVARRIWDGAGVHEGLLEEQISLGWGLVALGCVAVARWPARERGPGALVRVPVLVAVGVAALLCSLSPERTIAGFTVVRPSALLYDIVPMFRAYARFGVVVQLMAALLAGIGVDVLLRGNTAPARVACAALVLVAAAEYAVSPSSLSRDVLPTRAHRWVMQQTDRVRVLDCTPLSQESASVGWLTGARVSLLDDTIGDCIEPHLPEKLAADGYTHLLVRQGNREGRAFFDRPVPPGLRLAARFRDAQIFAVTAATPPVYTAAMTRFWPREHDGVRTWRWMGEAAAWTVVNTGARPIAVSLVVELSAFHHPRRMDLAFDGWAMQTIVVAPERRCYEAGPFTVAPGRHELAFQPIEPPARASDFVTNGDPRQLSYAVGAWAWTVLRNQP